MFSLRLPISVENTPTPLCNPHSVSQTPSSSSSSSSYLRSQTHRFPSLPLIPNSKQRRSSTTVSPPNVAVGEEVQGESNDGTSTVSEPMPPGLIPELMPKHVAVIMDGNGRWAKMRGLLPSAGHQAGVESLKKIIELCCSWGIRVLTVFAFSYDNWVRPKVEVDFLMSLFERTITAEIETFRRKGIRISVIGDTTKLPNSLQRMISSAEQSTKDNSEFQLIVAVSYSGKYDVIQACKSVAKKVQDGIIQLEDINETLIEQELETNCTEFPNPDLMIRTSGELRVSNFLLWQLAYAELYFDRQLWPDFGKEEFVEALASFQQRQRRFGARTS